MALIKKCNICSEKGMFLKLNNGLCQSCYDSMLQLENKYTKILQKIAISDDKEEILKELNLFIEKFKKFDGISTSISLQSCNKLLDKFSTNIVKKKFEINEINSTHKSFEHNQLHLAQINDQKSQNILSPNNSIDPNINSSTKEIKTAVKLDLKNIKLSKNYANKFQCPTKALDSLNNTKIKNVIEPVKSNKAFESSLDKNFSNFNTNNKPSNISKSLNFKLTKNNLTPSSKLTINDNLDKTNDFHKTSSLNTNFKKSINLNLNAHSSSLRSEKNTQISSHAIDQSLNIQNIKIKCSNLMLKMSNPNESIETVAKIYFNILNEILPILTENNISAINGENINTVLENCKNTLCLRCKKKEDELFDFFNYVSIFVQTTGLTPNNSDIIEISALKVCYGEIVDEFYTLVNPIKSIKRSVEVSTGISNSDVEASKTIDLILPDLLNFIGDFSLVTFNNKIVELFLNTNLLKLNIPKISKPIISTINLYRVRFKNYYGIPTTNSDINSCCKDLLSVNDLEYIDNFNTFSLSNSHAIYKLYEILKYRYK